MQRLINLFKLLDTSCMKGPRYDCYGLGDFYGPWDFYDKNYGKNYGPV